MNTENGLPLADFPVWARVNETLQGYADAIDRSDIDLLLTHFDADARWHYSPGVVTTGHAAIRSFFESRLAPFARTSHNVGPPVVRVGQGPEPIMSTAYVIADHQLKDGSRYKVCARYVDRLRLVGDRALICQREVIAHLVEGTSRAYNLIERKPVGDQREALLNLPEGVSK